MLEKLKELQRDAIQLQFGKNKEEEFFKKVSYYAPYLYGYMRILAIPNVKNVFKTFLYSLGQYRKLLSDSRTFNDGKKGIMNTIVNLQKELEK